MTARPISRYDLATWGFAAAALWLILHLKLLPALIAGLLVYVLVNLLTTVLRRNRILWGEGPRLVAVTIIALIVMTLLGMVGVFSYIGAAIQENVSGGLIEAGMRTVDGAKVYDFGPAILFWVGSSIASLVLATSLWRVKLRD